MTKMFRNLNSNTRMRACGVWDGHESECDARHLVILLFSSLHGRDVFVRYVVR